MMKTKFALMALACTMSTAAMATEMNPLRINRSY